MATNKVQVTKDYRLFERNSENRQVDIARHKKLLDSMKQYGFLRCFPMVVRRVDGTHLMVKDGQHRLAIAEMLGLPVYWIEEETDFDIAVINCTSKVWKLRDYAEKYAANGSKPYQEGLDFADQFSLPIGTAFSLLAGTTTFSNCQNQFLDGTFKVKDRPWADRVAEIYGPIVAMSPLVRNVRFIEACMAVCRVKDFDPKRLLAGAERCREKLVSFSTRDAYLDMMETIYNFGRKQLFGLKIAATMVMRERNATKGSNMSANQ